jgi:antimicrobial peptide system SdpB family protein
VSLILEALARLGEWGRHRARLNPWTDIYGLSRSLLAGASACTLAFNPTSVLFTPAVGATRVPICEHGQWDLSFFCIVQSDQLELARWLSVLLLAITASGLLPRLTALPHLWVSYSIFSSVTVRDGGDQVTLVLASLLFPVALLDPRQSHWSTVAHGWRPKWVVLLAWSCFALIRLQVAGIYFVAGVAKLAQPEWANGTAMYYWALYFAAPKWVVAALGRPIVAVVSTWGTILFELTLALGLVLAKPVWPVLLISGIAFHFLIAVFLGLWSFSIAMVGALVLYLCAPDANLLLSRRLQMMPWTLRDLFRRRNVWASSAMRVRE